MYSHREIDEVARFADVLILSHTHICVHTYVFLDIHIFADAYIYIHTYIYRGVHQIFWTFVKTCVP